VADTFQAVQFNSSREAFSSDGQTLNREVAKDNVLSNHSGVHVNHSAGGVTRMSVSPGGNTEAVFSSSSASVQMGELPNGEAGLMATAHRAGTPVSARDARPTDLIRVPGLGEVTIEVAQRIGLLSSNPESGRPTNATPEAISEATGKAAQGRAQAAAQEAQATEAERVSLNAHPVQEIEAAHQTFVSQVSESDKIGMLVQLGQGNVRPQLMHRVAEQMGMTPEAAGEAFKAVELGTRMQLTALARSKGVDVDAFANWARASVRSDRLLQAQQRHVLSRDLIGAWGGLIAEYKATLG
jgi:hypothetical protein